MKLPKIYLTKHDQSMSHLGPTIDQNDHIRHVFAWWTGRHTFTRLLLYSVFPHFA